MNKVDTFELSEPGDHVEWFAVDVFSEQWRGIIY